MCSVNAKEEATQSHDQGPHYHIIKPFYGNQRGPASQWLCPRFAILVGQGGREWHIKGASPILLQELKPGFWGGLHQDHLLREKRLRGIGCGRMEGGRRFPMSSDLSQDNAGGTRVRFGEILQSGPAFVNNERTATTATWPELPGSV